jgi:hypothetical protein
LSPESLRRKQKSPPVAEFAQGEQKRIKANSRHVNIRDGNSLQKGKWRIDPETNPDIYTTSAKTNIVWEPSKPDILRKGSEYNSSENRFVPEFIYQSQDNPNLVKIRETLKLDSIAGKGSELSQIFNLLHWVHNTVKHDGNSTNPNNKNAIELMSVCETEIEKILILDKMQEHSGTHIPIHRFTIYCIVRT